MANPQLEDGHTQIANEILEAMARLSLSANQWQILLSIIRKTYGYRKKVDWIANSQLMECTGLCKAVVSRALRNLTDWNIIVRSGKNLGINKDWEQWGKLAKLSTIEPKEPPVMRIVRSDGYIGIWRGAIEPEFQSMATKQGYALEHRLVMARLQGRCLESWEVVHHKGTKFPLGSIEDKGDNREENLELLPSQAAHLPSILAQQRITQLEKELAILLTSMKTQKLAIPSSTEAILLTKVSSCAVAQKKKETIQKKQYKEYGEFHNVLLTEKEHQQLIDRFGQKDTAYWIETLSGGMASNPKKYKYASHYAAILNWYRRDNGAKGKGKGTTAIPKRENYTKQPHDSRLE